MKKARKIRKSLEILPKWVYYLGSLFIAGPLGPIIIYTLFYVLKKIENLDEEDSGESYSYQRETRRAEPHTVVGEDYVVTSEPTEEKTEAKRGGYGNKAKTEEEEELAFDSENVDEIIRQGHIALKQIRAANVKIPDAQLSAQIDSIENSCRQILETLEQRPEILPQLRTFLRYYLPTTLKLLKVRAKLDRATYSPKAREVKNRVSSALGEIDQAFKNQVAALDEYSFVDLESEMDVLKDMLKADGLLDDMSTTAVQE